MICDHPSARVFRPHPHAEQCLSCGNMRVPDLDLAWLPAALPIDPDAFMTTVSDRKILLLNPRAQDVCIDDIAHHLALLPRFCGAIRFPFSVGAHSLNVMRALYRMLGGRVDPDEARHRHTCGDLWIPDEFPERRFWGALLRALFHDGSEAYLSDCIRPLKDLLPMYRRIESLHMQAIHEHLGFRGEDDDDWKDVDALIHELDFAVFAMEDRALRFGTETAMLEGVAIVERSWVHDRADFVRYATLLGARFASARRLPSDAAIDAAFDAWWIGRYAHPPLPDQAELVLVYRDALRAGAEGMGCTFTDPLARDAHAAGGALWRALEGP